MPVVCCAFLGSCDIRDDMSHCPALSVRVTATAQSGQPGGGGELQDADIDRVSLYIFDQDDKLLDIRATQVGKLEFLNYPDVQRFGFVALANVKENFDTVPMDTGDPLSQGCVSLCRSGETFLGEELHNFPDELFHGAATAPNDHGQTRIVEIPVRRMVAGVYVRVLGLRDHMESQGVSGAAYADERFSLVLGGGYNSVDMLGQPSYTARTHYAIKHMAKGQTQTPSPGKEVFNVPQQPAGQGQSAAYLPVLSSYEGAPLSVGLYYDEALIGDGVITADNTGGPLTTYNNKLSVVDIVFKAGGTIDVKVTQCEWKDVVEIEIEL